MEYYNRYTNIERIAVYQIPKFYLPVCIWVWDRDPHHILAIALLQKKCKCIDYIDSSRKQLHSSHFGLKLAREVESKPNNIMYKVIHWLSKPCDGWIDSYPYTLTKYEKNIRNFYIINFTTWSLQIDMIMNVINKFNNIINEYNYYLGTYKDYAVKFITSLA